MTPEIERQIQIAASDVIAAYQRLVDAVTEAEIRLRYSGDTFSDQGCHSRRDACWAAADALGAALSSEQLSGTALAAELERLRVIERHWITAVRLAALDMREVKE